MGAQGADGGFPRLDQGGAQDALSLLEAIGAAGAAGFAHAGAERQRPVGDAHNVGESDLGGRARQDEAALAAAQAVQKARLAQIEQDGFEEFGRQAARRGGDLGRAHRRAIRPPAVCSAFGGSYVTFLPALARDVLHQGSAGLGFLYAMVGAGAVAGAYVLTRIPDRFLRATPMLAALALGVSLVAFSQSRHFELSLALAFPCSMSLMLVGGATNSIVQLNAHNSMRGRVMGLYAMSFMGMAPSGALFLGLLAERIGTSATIGLGGLVCLMAAATARRAATKAR